MGKTLKRFSSLLIIVGLFLVSIGDVEAITATGSWSASDIVRQSGSLSLSFPAKGGSINGTFSGSGGKMFQYGGRFTGSFSGGWSGSMSGSFDGWVSYRWTNPATGQEELGNSDIYGSWNGSLSPDGTGHANFDNKAKYGLAGSVRLSYSVDQFEKEYGSKPGESGSSGSGNGQSGGGNSGATPSPTATPTPTPEPPQPRTMSLLGLNGQRIMNGKVRIRTKDGEIVEKEITNGQISFDKSEIKSMVIETDEGKRISLSGDSLDQSQVVIGDWKEWQESIKNKLQTLANILNNGEPVDLDKHFKIDWEAEDNQYQPPIFDFLRRFGVRDKISFYPGYITVNGDVNTPVHEALGHGLTEVIGDGNKMEHAGGPHDDPWQPTYNQRSKLNPMRWFGTDVTAVDEEQAKGFAMSEGWAQYVGDKWQRELTNTPDDKSGYTADKAKEKMEESKQGKYGSLYADEPGYGAKVENVVATAFNELYKGQPLEDAVRDFQAVREVYKQNNDGKSFQNINEFLEQKEKMATDQATKDKIADLRRELEL